jgi:transposase
MIPNITENPRNRKATKRGRKRLFNAAIHALRMRVERTFAWEDKFKRLLLRFEHIQQRHYGMKLMAYTSPFAPSIETVARTPGYFHPARALCKA